MQHPTILAAAWLAAKQAETEATERRRAIEDQFAHFLDLAPTDEGTKTAQTGDYQVKATTRLNRKIDAQLVQEIAAEHAIPHEILGRLFRWKPEINASAWKTAPEQITDILSKAITTTASRPSFSITLNA